LLIVRELNRGFGKVGQPISATSFWQASIAGVLSRGCPNKPELNKPELEVNLNA